MPAPPAIDLSGLVPTTTEPDAPSGAAESSDFYSLMPFFATIRDAVVHERDPLVAAWAQRRDDGRTIVLLGRAQGLAPTDVAVYEIGELLPGEEVLSVADAGVLVGGSGPDRLLALP